MASYSAVSLLLLAFVPSCQGQGFLAQKSDMRVGDLQGMMGEVLGCGHGVSSDRMDKIRTSLTPLFRSLPQNKKGRLSAQVMRYAVRRYFSQEHAWIVKGFEAHAEHINTSGTSEDILQSKVPDYIRSALEDKYIHDGFALEDVVAMVAAVERLTLDQVVKDMENCFWLNDLSLGASMNQTQMMSVLSSYLIISMFDGARDKAKHQFDKTYINIRYPHWDETLLFLVDIASSDKYERKPSSNPFVESADFVFNDLIRMSVRVTEEFGPWSDHECHLMKDTLAQKDVHGSGRVKLADFYGKTKDGAWQFTEQTEYLRQLGVVDESSASLGPQVLIQNYITGLSNCITSAQYYSICCLNECDQIYQHLEAKLLASTATPNQIIEVVEQMQFGSNITDGLRAKLEMVARIHDGKVPVYGRLLAQWLHFTFPYECPYPFEAGTITPKSPSEWRLLMGQEADSVSEDEVNQVIEADKGFKPLSVDDALMSWTLKESLLDHSTESDQGMSRADQLRIFAQFSMILSSVAIILRMLGLYIYVTNDKDFSCKV